MGEMGLVGDDNAVDRDIDADILVAAAADPVFYCLYLLFLQEQLGGRRESASSFVHFVLWLITHGRRTFLYPFAVPDEIIEIITQPGDHGKHLLMAYAVGAFGPKPAAGSVLDDELVRAIYYYDLVPRLNLAPYLGREELRYLNERSKGRAAPAGLSKLSNVYRSEFQANVDESALHDVRELVGTLAAATERGSLPSVSIVGFHRSVLGIGEDARCLLECFVEAGVRAELVDVSPASLEKSDRLARYKAFEAQQPTGDVVIFCMPPFEMTRTIANLGLPRGGNEPYRIGYWPWETTALPQAWLPVFDMVDEVWASSRFLEACFRRQTEKQVTYMPPYVEVESPLVSTDLEGLFDGRFTFFSIFDFNSRIERKNPIGAINAFLSAFGSQDEAVQLVFKTLHGETNEAQLEAIQNAMAGDERILLIDGALSKAEVCGLLAGSDAYLSLHRSEGLGRPLIEAMFLGVPVIGTQWSGSADFLNGRTGYPIRSTLRAVQAHEYPFAAGEWAEPDTAQAAQAMRSLFEGRAGQKAIASAARAWVTEHYSRANASKRLRRRLKGIQGILDKSVRRARIGK